MHIKAKPVDGIKDRNDIERLRTHFKTHYRHGDMYSLLLTVGCNTGLRVSDLVHLRYGDFKDKEYLTLVEQKTKKNQSIFINQRIRDEIAYYLRHTLFISDSCFLFSGQKGLPLQPKHSQNDLPKGKKANIRFNDARRAAVGFIVSKEYKTMDKPKETRYGQNKCSVGRFFSEASQVGFDYFF